MLRTLAWILFVAVGCSSGALDEKRNYYLSIFGIKVDALNAAAGGVIGRAITTDGKPVTNAQVFVRGQRSFALTNDKGGFYFPNMAPGTYDIYVLANDFLGAAYQTKVKAGEVSENPEIALAELMRVSGKVTTDDVTKGQAKVSIDGTPFQSDTDKHGEYLLKLPRGKYVLSAQHILYEPFESELLEISQDTEFNITMAPYEFPTARISIESEDGFVVRGSITKLHIKPGKGVQAMRIVRFGTSTETEVRDVLPFDQWVRVQPELEIQHQGDGYSQIAIVFSDAFGKMSDPVRVSYYNTSYGSDWRVLYGYHRDPVVVKQGEKALLLSDYSYFTEEMGTSGGEAHGGEVIENHGPLANAAHAMRLRIVLRGGQDVRDISKFGTAFANGFLAEAGTTIHGGGLFAGDVKFLGSADGPISWAVAPVESLFGEAMFIAENVTINHTRISGGSLHFDQSLINSSAAIDHSEFNEVEIRQTRVRGTKDFDTQSSLKFNASKLYSTYLQTYCGTHKLNVPPFPELGDGGALEPLEPKPPAALQKNPQAVVSLELQRTELKNSTIYLDCNREPNSEPVAFRLILHQNNFLELLPNAEEDERYYFARSSEDGIPRPEDIDYRVSENYFLLKSRLFDHMGAWPAYFGTAVTAPF